MYKWTAIAPFGRLADQNVGGGAGARDEQASPYQAHSPHPACFGRASSAPRAQKVRSTGSIIRGHVRGTCPRLGAHDARRQYRHSQVTLAAVLWLFVVFDHNATRSVNAISGSCGFLTLGIHHGWLGGALLAPSATFRACRAPARLITILDTQYCD